MKIYNFYWAEYEGYSPHNLTHKEDKTQEQFEIDCKNALINCGKEYIDQEESWVGIDGWIVYAVDYMIKNMGYKTLDEVSYGLCNAMIISGGNHKYETNYKIEDLDEDGKGVLEVVGKELFDKAIEHNKKIDEKIYEK